MVGVSGCASEWPNQPSLLPRRGRPFSITPRSRALPSFVAVLASLAFAEASQLPKIPEIFPSTPLAGVAFCRFSELCHPVKGSSHLQSWLGQSLVSYTAGASSRKGFLQASQKTKKCKFFPFFFREIQWLICKISLWLSCTGADVHKKWLT